MLPVEFVRKYFLFLSAIGALADKRGQILVRIESGAMYRFRHEALLCVFSP